MSARVLRKNEKTLLLNIDLSKFDLYDCEGDGLFALQKSSENIECPWCHSKEVYKIGDAEKAQHKFKEQENEQQSISK